MSEIEVPKEKPRRWGAYVCPDCRFIFRVPRDYDGTGIVCASCRKILRVPKPGDETPPLVLPLNRIGFSEDEANASGSGKRRRSKRKSKGQEAVMPEWDSSAGTWRSSRSKSRKMALMYGKWVGSMLAIVVLLALFMKLTGPEKVVADSVHAERQDEFDQLVDGPLTDRKGGLDTDIELPKVMKRNQNEFLALAEPMAKSFLEAEHINEILPLIHDKLRVEPLIRAYYPKGKIDPVSMSKFNPSGNVAYKEEYAAVSFLTRDHEMQQLAYIDGEDGLKIDWESWVGWSEMSWPDIIAKKPTDPVLIRAKVKQVDYYNYGFQEDAWRSYRLTSPDNETVLYGYVERNSLLDQRLRPVEASRTVSVTMKVQHSKDVESADNQVVISQYVADGWVVVEEP